MSNQLMDIEDEKIMAVFHQEVQKSRDKYWYDKYINKNIFKEGDLVFLHDTKFFQHPGKFRIHLLGPYEVKSVTDGDMYN
jgi:hypothetical protein